MEIENSWSKFENLQNVIDAWKTSNHYTSLGVFFIRYRPLVLFEQGVDNLCVGIIFLGWKYRWLFFENFTLFFEEGKCLQEVQKTYEISTFSISFYSSLPTISKHRISNFCLQIPTISNPLFFKFLEFPEKNVISGAASPSNEGWFKIQLKIPAPYSLQILGFPHVQFYNFQIFEFPILEFRHSTLEIVESELY